MYHNYSQEELRAYCRSSIESLEIWARRLIHEKLVENYGDGYVDAINVAGEWIVKKEIRMHIHQMMEKDPQRFSRAVDALYVDHIIYFLCNPKWYKELFKPALDHAFPQGCEEVREYLNRLIPVRNALSHANPISIRQAEQAVCYSHDFVEGLLDYYKEIGKERMWNVPRIIRVLDSCGNEIMMPSEGNGPAFMRITPEFHVGDTYSVQIEVDPAFLPESYYILWHVNHRRIDYNSPHLTHTFTTMDIGQNCLIECTIISKKEWHKHCGYDDSLNLVATVLPVEF